MILSGDARVAAVLVAVMVPDMIIEVVMPIVVVVMAMVMVIMTVMMIMIVVMVMTVKDVRIVEQQESDDNEYTGGDHLHPYPCGRRHQPGNSPKGCPEHQAGQSGSGQESCRQQGYSAPLSLP